MFKWLGAALLALLKHIAPIWADVITAVKQERQTNDGKNGDAQPEEQKGRLARINAWLDDAIGFIFRVAIVLVALLLTALVVSVLVTVLLMFWSSDQARLLSSLWDFVKTRL